MDSGFYAACAGLRAQSQALELAAHNLMLSVAEVFRSLAMGVIMTGMGADGARGMEAIRNEGGLTVGQDEASCTVYGMPRSCAEIGVLRRVVPLMQIPQQIMQAVGYRRRQ